MLSVPSDAEKNAVWDAYRARRPVRVPLTWGVNARIILLDPDLNPEGYTFEQYFNHPPVTLAVQARVHEYEAVTLSQSCDRPAALPERWTFSVDNQNVYDAACLGAAVQFVPGQVPYAAPAFGLDDVDDLLRRDPPDPLDGSWLKGRLEFREALVREAEHFEHLGRKGIVSPLAMGFDGPLTALASLMGMDAFVLLKAHPDRARRLLLRITRHCMARNKALADLAGGWKPAETGSLADDSIQLISPAMYRELVMPAHALWYDEMSATRPADRKRHIHLCGDATRHFKTLRDELGVYSFDTGFPVDHGALRRELGPEVEIYGGPRVDLLLRGTPDQCAEETRRILQSGIMDGGRFVLREGNNLPPRVPPENLHAVYETCLQYGRYDN